MGDGAHVERCRRLAALLRCAWEGTGFLVALLDPQQSSAQSTAMHRGVAFGVIGVIGGMPELVVWLPILLLLHPRPSAAPPVPEVLTNEEATGLVEVVTGLPDFVVHIMLAAGMGIQAQAEASPVLASVLLAAVAALMLGCLPVVAVRFGAVIMGFLALA